MITPYVLAKRRIGALLVLVVVGVIAAGGTWGQSASRPADSKPVELQLRDWVLHPPLVDDEQADPGLRIVSAAPNITEICCALGLSRQLVGRTRFCTYPPAIQHVPSIGALIDTNVEVLLHLKPDMILVAGRSRVLTERLTARGLRLESLPDRSLADIFSAIRRAGSLARRPKTARELCTGIRAELDAVAKRFAHAPRARVLMVIGTLSDPPAPPFVAGPGSFYDDLLRQAGHQNVVESHGASFAPLSLEFILKTDPDVIIELDADGRARPNGDRDALRVWAKVGSLRAVADRRIHVLSGPQHFLAGPRIAQTFEALCRAIAQEEDE
jgi:iron complex transport system substrate-binding protein